PDNLIVDPPARQEPVPLEIGWIITVFCYYDNAIHCKFLPSKRNGFADRLKDRNTFRFSDLLAEYACVMLVHVNRCNFHPGGGVGTIPPITVNQLVHDPVRMGSWSAPKADQNGDAGPCLRGLRKGAG